MGQVNKKNVVMLANFLGNQELYLVFFFCNNLQVDRKKYIFITNIFISFFR